MAVTLDSTSKGGSTPLLSSSLTFAHTCSGDDRILVVMVWENNTVNNPTGVTYNSVSLTRLTSVSKNENLSLWYLLSPDTGTHNIVASYGNDNYSRAISASFNGANNISNGTATTSKLSNPTISITSSTGNVCISAVGDTVGNLSIGAGVGQTVDYIFPHSSWFGMGASHINSSSGSTSMSYSGLSTSSVELLIGAEIIAGSQTSSDTSKFFQLFN